MAIGAGGTVGIALSGAGVGVENRVRTLVKAFISGSDGIVADNISLSAHDNTRITADAGAASLAGSAAGTVGVSLSVGIAVAFNEVSNVVEASIANADPVTALGDITIDARTIGGTIPESDYSDSSGWQLLRAGETVTLNSGYAVPDYDTTAAPGQTSKFVAVKSGDFVLVTDDYDEDYGTAGVVYEYIGVARNLDLLRQDYDQEYSPFWVAVGGEAGRVYHYHGFVADFSSAAGSVEEPEQELDNGDTVRVAPGHLAGGTIGGVYIWKGGDEEDVDLRQEHYGDTSRWTLVLPDYRYLGAEDYSDTELWELADGTITARVGAASLAAGFAGTVGGAISGAGAVATNVILTRTSSSVDASNIVQARDVTLGAENKSTIVATVAALSVAIGAGGTVGAGVSIGASVSRNFIGYNQEGQEQAAEVMAYLRDSSINASGDLTLAALANERIDAVVLAGSAAIAGGGVAGIAASGAGVSAVNRIANHVAAFIDGDGENGITAASVSVSATDSSAIHAVGGAASIAVSFAGTGAASLSVGVALAENTINNLVQASISNANDLEATAGNVTVTAAESNSIAAITVAASAAIAIAPASIAISGGLASALNTITSTTTAFVEDSADVEAAGAVSVEADDTAAIDARIDSIAAAGGVISVAVGLGLAMNAAENKVRAFIRNSSINAGSGNIEVISSSHPVIETRTEATALSIGFGVGAGRGEVGDRDHSHHRGVPPGRHAERGPRRCHRPRHVDVACRARDQGQFRRRDSREPAGCGSDHRRRDPRLRRGSRQRDGEYARRAGL